MNKIDKVIKEMEHDCFVFIPNQEFYNKVEINQKRWGQIRRGQADPTLKELTAIADFLKIDVRDLV